MDSLELAIGNELETSNDKLCEYVELCAALDRAAVDLGVPGQGHHQADGAGLVGRAAGHQGAERQGDAQSAEDEKGG